MKIVNINALYKLIKESNSIKKSKSPIVNLKNFYLNYQNSKILANKLEDFTEYHFGEQIRIVYEDTRAALIRKEFPILLRSLVNFNLTETNFLRVDEMNEYLQSIKSQFDYPTSKWKMIYLRITDDNTMAFVTFRYFSNNKENYFSAVRDLKETKNFFSWRLLLPSQEEINEKTKSNIH